LLLARNFADSQRTEVHLDYAVIAHQLPCQRFHEIFGQLCEFSGRVRDAVWVTLLRSISR
jgi:hypothetical protein